MDFKSVGKNICQCRQKKHMRQEELAEKAGIFAIMSSDEFKKRVLHFEENTHIAAVYLIYSAFSPPIWYNFNQEVLV